MDYSLFSEISSWPLRAFNRFMYARNLFEDKGRAYMEDYVNQFTEADRQEMKMIGLAINLYGEKETRRLVTEGLEFPENA